MIVVTAVASTETAVEAMKLGAYDYVTKPFKLDEVDLIIANGLERKRLRGRERHLRKQLETQHRFENIIGKSRRIVARVRHDPQDRADSPATVLITGESGTGKELVARGDPRTSRRARQARSSPSTAAAIPEGARSRASCSAT